MLLVLVVLLIGGPSLLTSPGTSEIAPETEEAPELVYPEDSQSGFWAYLNARESFEQRSPANVVVRGETDEVVRIMTEEGEGDWDVTDEEHEDAGPGTFSVEELDEIDDDPSTPATETGWDAATGTTRYAYVDSGDGSDGQWVTETLQLDDGDYYGSRYHIRLYESPNPEDEWTVMQGHTEHFDWFTLRHRVDGVEEAQSYIESEFMGQPFVDEVWRAYLGNEGASDSDGWATVVELAVIGALPAVGGLLAFGEGLGRHLTRTDRRRLRAARERITLRHLLLFGTIASLLLGVRFAGIALERHVPALSMHAIASLLYPVIGLGIPIAAYAIANGMERRIDSAVTAAVGLSVAVWLDYAYLGVAYLPIDVVVQRMLVVLALGLIAGGAARRATRESRWNDMLLTGSALWMAVLVGTLLGYL